MKKIIALVVAILMIASMSVVVFAETDYSGAAAQPEVGDGTELTYTVAKGYVITIPADIAFEGATLSSTDKVSVEKVKLPGNEQLVVSVASDNGWKLVDTDSADGQSDDVVYSAYFGSTDATGTKLIAAADTATDILDINMYQTGVTVADGAAGEVDMYFVTAGTAQVGIYTDLLTFTTELRAFTKS